MRGRARERAKRERRTARAFDDLWPLLENSRHRTLDLPTRCRVWNHSPDSGAYTSSIPDEFDVGP